MEDRKLIAETSLDGLRPRGVGGRLAIESYDQIISYLGQKLGKDYVDLFAQPVEGRESIFWYGPASGEAIPLADLPEAERAQVLAKLSEREQRIGEHAEQLKTASDPAAQQLGKMLEKALVTPVGQLERNVIYAIAGEPVLVSWGISDDQPGPDRQYLREFLRARQTPPAPAPPIAGAPNATAAAATAAPLVIEERSSPWWNLLWLLLLLLLAAIWYILLEGCGFLGGGRLINYCPFVASAAENPADRTDNLRRELARLEERMAPLPLCETGRRPAPRRAPSSLPSGGGSSAQGGSQPDEDDFSERLRTQGAQEDCDVSVSLKWDTPSDLDLHLVCPEDQINFRSQSACGGELDVDANREETDIMAAPVENICIARGNGQSGQYQIFVHNYRKRSPEGMAKDSFQLRVRQNGETRVYDGALGQNENSLVTIVEIE